MLWDLQRQFGEMGEHIPASRVLKRADLLPDDLVLVFRKSGTWAVDSRVGTADEARNFGRTVQRNLLGRRALPYDAPDLRDKPLIVVYQGGHVELPPLPTKVRARRTAPVKERKDKIVARGQAFFGRRGFLIRGKQGAYVVSVRPVLAAHRKIFSASSGRVETLDEAEKLLDHLIKQVEERMRESNPSVDDHFANIENFLSSAEKDLSRSEKAFRRGDAVSGWLLYLDAFKELGRAQQEILYVSEEGDDDMLEALDAFNERIARYDERIRSSMLQALNAELPVDQMFRFEIPTAIAVGDDVVRVPLSRWEDMKNEIVLQAIARYGSVRRASPHLGVPKTTLATWYRAAQEATGMPARVPASRAAEQTQAYS